MDKPTKYQEYARKARMLDELFANVGNKYRPVFTIRQDGKNITINNDDNTIKVWKD